MILREPRSCFDPPVLNTIIRTLLKRELTDGPTLFFSVEQKRRQAIRDGFDRLTELVPGLEGQGRSEGLVLQRTIQFMRDQLAENQRMVEEIERRGGEVPERLKL